MRACSSLNRTSHLPSPLLSPRKKLRFLSPPSIVFSNSRVSLSLRPNGRGNCNWKLQGKRKQNGDGDDDEEEEEEERRVHCEVDVVSWRERRIRAQILVDAGVDEVWRALTDYERLANFIPNLVYSGRIPCPHKGRIWLEQRGLQRSLYWHIEARVVLDLQEFPDLVLNILRRSSRDMHFAIYITLIVLGSTTTQMKERGEITDQAKTPKITWKTQIGKNHEATHKSTIHQRDHRGKKEKPHSCSVQ